MNERCANHPNHVALEPCEVCEKPLCGLCLWYTDDGHRLCEEHAKEAAVEGQSVTSPEHYAEALQSSVQAANAEQKKESAGNPSEKIYRGNNFDLAGAIGAGLSVVVLGSCMGGIYCFPFVAGGIALYAYLNADKSLDPKRTRNMSLIGMAVAGFFLLVILAFIMFYVVTIIFAISSGP